jgi:hypothetical protein
MRYVAVSVALNDRPETRYCVAVDVASLESGIQTISFSKI